MRLFLGLILILPVVANAAPKSRTKLEQELLRSFRETKQVLSINLQKMSESDIKQSTQLIEGVRSIGLGKGYAGGRDEDEEEVAVKTCSTEKKEVFEATSAKLRTFANAPVGLNRSMNDAVAFAKEWTGTFTCDKADKFIKDHTRIKNFAASKTGLDFPMAEAITYATRKISKFCDNFDLENEYKNFFNYASSPVGLKKATGDAKNYARMQAERDAFSCENF